MKKINWDFVIAPVAALIQSFVMLFIGVMLGIAIVPTFLKYHQSPEVGYSIVLALLMLSGLLVVIREVVSGALELRDDMAIEKLRSQIESSAETPRRDGD